MATDIAAATGVKVGTVHGWITLAYRAGLITGKMHRWTSEEDGELARLYRSRIMVPDIAMSMNLPLGKVHARIMRLKLKRGRKLVWRSDFDAPARQMVAAGKTDSEVGDALGIGRHAVTKFRRLHGIAAVVTSPWTADADATLRKLYARGDRREDIADALGLKIGQINGRLARLCLTRPTRPYPTNRKSADRDYAHLRDPAVRAKAAETRKLNAKPRPKAKAPVEDCTVIPLDARPFLSRQMTKECAYPYGQAGAIHVCCKPVFGGTSYCEGHAALCFNYAATARAA